MPTSLIAPVVGAVAGKVLMGDGEAPSQTQTTTRQVPAWLQPLLEANVERGVDLSNIDYTPYGEDRVAQLTQEEHDAIGLGQGLAGNYQEIARRGLEGFTPEQIQGYMNPYQEQVMDASRRRQLSQFDVAKRDLASQQANIGAFGGSRTALAEQDLYKNFGQQLADTEAQQLYTGYGDAYNRATQGTQLAGTATTQGLQGAGMLQALGGVKRGISQAEMDVGYQDFLTEQQYPYQQAQYAQSFINPAAGLTTGSETTGIQNPGQASGASIGMGLGSMLGSSGIMNNLWGTSAGTPMTGGFQGPTQGSGLSGFFSGGSFEEGGLVKGYANGGVVNSGGLSRLDAFLKNYREANTRREEQDKDVLRDLGAVPQGISKYFTSADRPALGESLASARAESLQELPTRRPESEQPLPTRRPEIDTTVDELLKLLSSKGRTQETAPAPKQKESGYNEDLFRFGASLLGSEGKGFFSALGDASKVYADSKSKRSTAEAEAEKLAIKQAMDERRLAAYEQQTSAASSKIPLQQEVQRMKLLGMQRKLQSDPRRDSLIKEIVKANPMMEPAEVLQTADSLLGQPSQAGSYQEGQTATNPETGQKMQYTNGQWSAI